MHIFFFFYLKRQVGGEDKTTVFDVVIKMQ